jgi:hypothetical protein
MLVTAPYLSTTAAVVKSIYSLFQVSKHEMCRFCVVIIDDVERILLFRVKILYPSQEHMTPL